MTQTKFLTRASDALIDAPALRKLLGAERLCVLDCRHDLANPALGREQYELGHVPGAVHVHLDEDLSGSRNGRNGRHPLPESEALAARLRALGIGVTSHVVAYDASEGSFAARAWWLLRWLGHARVSVLDGGWQGWLAAGGPTSRETPAPVPGNLVVGAPLERIVGADAVLELAQGREQGAVKVLIDARAPDRYAGRNETIDPVAGHIPGAINRFWKHNLGADGRFKPADSLRSEYEGLLAGRPATELVAQCGSGVTACHDLLAMHVAGLRGAALYPGSWSEWISDPARPVATGPEPR
jgi:thiosulfate/3-mercaptopyruvate sulfurtransferase